VGNVTHLNAVNQGSATSNGCDDVDGFGHFRQIGSFFQAGLCVGVDAVRALNRVGYGQRNEGFFAFRQLTFGEYGILIIEEFLRQLRRLFSDLFKTGKILGVIIGVHEI
jgi:hypothetical protein